MLKINFAGQIHLNEFELWMAPVSHNELMYYYSNQIIWRDLPTCIMAVCVRFMLKVIFNSEHGCVGAGIAQSLK
jgi:hypothetical protein